MIRRLPLFFLIDTSRSMGGVKIQGVINGLSRIVNILRKDPQGIEIAHISIITFSNEGKVIVPLTHITKIIIPEEVETRGWTNIESGLRTVFNSIEKDVYKTDINREVKGDYKPLLFMFSDGGQSKGNWKNLLKDDIPRYFGKMSSVNAFVATGGQYKSYFDEIKSLVGEYGTATMMDDFNEQEFSKVINIVSQSVSSNI